MPRNNDNRSQFYVMQIDHVEVGRLTLACRKAGKRSDPCLVLLHGWPQTGLAWEGVLSELGKDSYALAFDLPGVGDSKGAPSSAEKTELADVILSTRSADRSAAALSSLDYFRRAMNASMFRANTTIGTPPPITSASSN
jgi:pimeloyl-ACP methyl ester carboxylesterase